MGRAIAFFGWILLVALQRLAAIADRVWRSPDRPSFGEVVFGVLFIPAAFLIVGSMALGRDAFLHFVAAVTP